MTTGTAWADWLKTAARFHHYSFRNTVAIWAQRPEATQVAGYRVWQSMGRQVRKGERGIEILAPVTRRQDDPAGDSSGDGEAAAGPVSRAGVEDVPAGATSARRRVVGYRITHVFDIAQTDLIPGVADTFAVVEPALLTGPAPQHLWDGLARQVAEAGYQLAVEPLPGGANGRTHFVDRVVTVTPELEPAQKSKTLSHEMAHVTLHEPETVAARADSPVPVCRGRIEVEAESVAYLIASAQHLDSSAFSFAYIAGWAQGVGGGVERVMAETATRVLGAAHQILDRLDRDNPAPLPVAEDAVPFELPGPAPAPRGAPVTAPGNAAAVPPFEPSRHPVIPRGSTATLGVDR
ncbi:MAG: ArdC family protein [Lapillicoccus sp.]